MSVADSDAGRSYLPGILYICAGILFLTAMDGVAKWLVEADYSPFQVLAVRGWIITTVLLAWSWRSAGGLRRLATARPMHHALRTAIGFLAPFSFFSALKEMPLADATVVFFGAPFMMAALSVPLLKEHVGLHRWGAIVVGFVGVVIALQPGEGTFQAAAFLVLGGSLAYSLINIMGRWMGRTETAFQMVFYFNFGTALIATCALPFVWQDMPLEHLGVIGILAALAIVGHIFMTKAFFSAPVGVVAPFEYTALIWSTLIGFLVWGDWPVPSIWIGAGVIAASGLYLVHREGLNRRRS